MKHGFSMENEGNVAYIAKIYPQISKEGQESLENMAQAMLSIQNSGIPPIPDYNDKVKFMAQAYPKISPQAQEYLGKIAHAMLRIQNPAVSPIPGKQSEGDLK
jgi:hypothetical protein